MIIVEEYRKQQLHFIGLTDKDLTLLNENLHYFEQISEEVVSRLYIHIAAQPHLLAIIEKYSSIERLKETQRWYFISLASGIIDDGFISKRLQVGAIHSRIGLTTNWYLGCYMIYLDIATIYFKQLMPDNWIEVILAISKMFNLDSQLVLEAYEQDEKAKIQQIADSKQNMLQGITRAIQELASMMAELSGSTQSIATTAMHTADSQEKSHQLVEKLNEEVAEIYSMGSLMREISDQTHLLGLNAAIEAARAGNEGRGFEVVANEIRKLASHSKKALEQIQDVLSQINALLAQVQRESEQTAVNAREQAGHSEELVAFVEMIEQVTLDLELLKESQAH